MVHEPLEVCPASLYRCRPVLIGHESQLVHPAPGDFAPCLVGDAPNVVFSVDLVLCHFHSHRREQPCRVELLLVQRYSRLLEVEAAVAARISKQHRVYRQVELGLFLVHLHLAAKRYLGEVLDTYTLGHRELRPDDILVHYFPRSHLAEVLIGGKPCPETVVIHAVYPCPVIEVERVVGVFPLLVDGAHFLYPLVRSADEVAHFELSHLPVPAWGDYFRVVCVGLAAASVASEHGDVCAVAQPALLRPVLRDEALRVLLAILALPQFLDVFERQDWRAKRRFKTSGALCKIHSLMPLNYIFAKLCI